MFIVTSFSDSLLHWFHPRRSNNHRPRVLHPQILGLLALSIFGLALAGQPLKHVIHRFGGVLGYASNISAGDVVAQVNQRRADAGEGALVTSSALNQAAFAKAQNMLALQYWAHVAPDGTQPWFFFKQAGYRYSIAGENLARDFETTGDMVQGWMDSPTHKENILNSRYRETGVAVVNGSLEGVETTLVVQLFGAPQNQAPTVKATDDSTPKVAAKAPVQTKTVAKTSSTVIVSSPAPTSSPQPTGLPSPTPIVTIIEGQSEPARPEITLTASPGSETDPRILGSTVLPITVLGKAPLFSPLQLIKAFFLAIIFVISATLFYDWVIMNNRNTVRLVGKNLAHILLFLTVAFLLVFFKGGVIG